MLHARSVRARSSASSLAIARAARAAPAVRAGRSARAGAVAARARHLALARHSTSSRRSCRCARSRSACASSSTRRSSCSATPTIRAGSRSAAAALYVNSGTWLPATRPACAAASPTCSSSRARARSPLVELRQWREGRQPAVRRARRPRRRASRPPGARPVRDRLDRSRVGCRCVEAGGRHARRRDREVQRCQVDEGRVRADRSADRRSMVASSAARTTSTRSPRGTTLERVVGRSRGSRRGFVTERASGFSPASRCAACALAHKLPST